MSVTQKLRSIWTATNGAVKRNNTAVAGWGGLIALCIIVLTNSDLPVNVGPVRSEIVDRLERLQERQADTEAQLLRIHEELQLIRQALDQETPGRRRAR